VAVDGSGNVFVAGSSVGSGGYLDYATIAYSGAGVPLWTNRYNGPANFSDFATALAVDANGNVFVTGYSFGTQFNQIYSKSDYATIAYSGAGVPLWTNRYNGPGNGANQATAVAVDGSGNVFVTGHSGGDYATIAYSGAGVPLWTNRCAGQASALAVDSSGNVLVTGWSVGSGADYVTIAYSGAGVPLWTNRHDGPANGNDYAGAVAVDGSGNVFVAGSSADSGGDSDYATIAYSGAGVPLWTNRFGGRGATSDIATAVAVDASGNVFVVGNSYGREGNPDYATIKYSGAGVALWTNRCHGSTFGRDRANAVALDGSGNVFVAGNSATIAYSGAGTPLWTNSGFGTAIALDGRGNVFVTGSYATIAYSGAGVPLWINDGGAAIAVDASGNVFVTGHSFSGNYSNSDYATIAYSGAGVPLWTNRYNGPGNGGDHANAVAVDSSGNVFVTGSSTGSGGDSDYATIKYSDAGVPLWTNRYNGPANVSDQASAVAVDAIGNVFVTGSSGDDSATIAYSGAGVPLWTNRYSRPEGFFAHAVAVDASGNVFVTGSSATIAYSGAGVPLCTNRYGGSDLAIGSDGAVYVTGTSDGLFLPDFVTVKYVWRTEIAIQLLSTISPKVNLTLSGAPNSSWAIERAMQPTGPWTNLSALLIGTNGSAQFQDTNLPYPAGFYRARQQ
jgi:hypothetical protein